MAYNITIKVRNIQDVNGLSNLITSYVEQSTGQRVQVIVKDKRKAIQEQQKRLQSTYKRLLK